MRGLQLHPQWGVWGGSSIPGRGDREVAGFQGALSRMWVAVRLENMFCSGAYFPENVGHRHLEKQRVRAQCRYLGVLPVSMEGQGGMGGTSKGFLSIA